MSAIVRQVAGLLTTVDPARASTYRSKAARYVARLDGVDARYRMGLASCARHEIVTSHEAFGWLAARYGLVQLGITGLNPEAEPTAAKLSELTDLVHRDHVTTVFTETLVSPRAAAALAREAGVRTEVLDPIEGLTKSEESTGADYVSLMDANLVKLRTALGCA
jgi:zinc transport system substrate-binding protein